MPRKRGYQPKKTTKKIKKPRAKSAEVVPKTKEINMPKPTEKAEWDNTISIPKKKISFEKLTKLRLQIGTHTEELPDGSRKVSAKIVESYCEQLENSINMLIRNQIKIMRVLNK